MTRSPFSFLIFTPFAGFESLHCPPDLFGAGVRVALEHAEIPVPQESGDGDEIHAPALIPGHDDGAPRAAEVAPGFPDLRSLSSIQLKLTDTSRDAAIICFRFSPGVWVSRLHPAFSRSMPFCSAWRAHCRTSSGEL